MRKFLLIAFFLGVTAQVCLCQSNPAVYTVIPEQGCGDRDFEAEGFEVAAPPKITTPYKFLPWMNSKVKKAEAEIWRTLFETDRKFTYEKALTKAPDIIDKAGFFVDTTDARVRITVATVAVENCSGNKLELVYGLYSTQILEALSGTIEARKEEKESPQTAAGFDNINFSEKAVKFVPTVGYDSTNKLGGGGRLEITPRQWRNFTFNSLSFEGQASPNMRYFSADLAGSHDSEGWLKRSDWRVNYAYRSLPTEIGNIKQAKLSAQFSGVTRSLANDGFTVRFGGLIEGGNQQSSIRDVPLTSDTVSNTSFGAVKFYVGLDSRLRHNIFSVSYGLQLGAAGRTPRIDWVKQVADIKHEFWYPLGDHRILDLESQLTLGFIQVPGKIPLNERFFGGNNQKLFIPNDTWQIRENPVIRAIPGSRLYRTFEGVGADGFFSYNLTAAYTIWRKPLVPTEVTSEPKFKEALSIAIDSMLNVGEYVVQDPEFNPTFEHLKNIRPVLPKFTAALDALKAKFPDQFESRFNKCGRRIRAEIREIDSALKPDADLMTEKFPPAFNWGEGAKLKNITKDCVDEIRQVLPDEPLFVAELSELQTVQAEMNRQFKRINYDAALKKARQEETYRFTGNTLKTLLYDVNMYSVSPVFVFDIARISPRRAGFGGFRYGPGVGIRLELINSVNLTAGYAWNVRQRPGEGRGNVFFSFGLRDVFSFK